MCAHMIHIFQYFLMGKTLRLCSIDFKIDFSYNFFIILS